MTRTVILHLLDGNGTPLGSLPPYDVPAPWWQEIGDVVAGARQRYGLDVSVLRLLRADRPEPPGGTVSYLAQIEAPTVPGRPPVGFDATMLVPSPVGFDATFASSPVGFDATVLAPPSVGFDVDLSVEPLRAPWAVPGGPAASLRWAGAELTRLGRGEFVAVPQRAWNLSAIWRLDGSGAPVWLKQVPGFFVHEAVVLRWLGTATPDLVPVLLAADGAGRMLLEHVPGEDGYGLDPAGRDAIAADQHRVQSWSTRRVEGLVAEGVPDRRGAALVRTVRGRLSAHGADLAPVRPLLEGLAGRMAEVAGCGLPDVLVHGDLHPGNARIADGRRVLIDWGDAFVGHPAFDILRLTEGLDPADAGFLIESWARRWRASVPGCDPARAVELLRPVAALRMAAVYADFLARIEPSERVFHAADVPAYLDSAVRLS